jgi:hypothetical protein
MLHFTQDQQRMIFANRQAFNAQQRSMAERLGNATMVGNAMPIPYNVWGQWDREGVAIQRQVMSVFNDLAASVSFPIPIGKLLHYFQTISDSGQVNVSMDGRSKARADQPVFEYFGTPLPIFDTTFSYGWRQVEAAQSEGFQLDAAGRRNAMFKVAESLEQMVISGNSKVVAGGQTLYGLTNHPKRNSRSTGNALRTCTGAQWQAEVNATLALLFAKNFYAPATLYVNWLDWRYATSTDYSTLYPNKSIAARILEDSQVKEVIPSSYVPAQTIIAVVKDPAVVQILNAMPMTNRAQFRANPEDEYNFVTMAAAAIEIKFDATNQCGVAVSA